MKELNYFDMQETDNQFKLPEILLKRFNQFKKIDDSTKRFERIIQLGKRIEPLGEEFKIDANQVHGCASLVYIVGEKVDGKMQFKGWSNSHLVIGLLALLIEGINGTEVEKVLDIDPAFIEGMGLAQTLTASRANGFLNTFKKMMEITKACS